MIYLLQYFIYCMRCNLHHTSKPLQPDDVHSICILLLLDEVIFNLSVLVIISVKHSDRTPFYLKLKQALDFHRMKPPVSSYALLRVHSLKA